MILLLIVMAFLLKMADKHDALMNEAADQYEHCVQVQYGMTPSMWYAQNGQYPTCPITK